MRTKYTYSLLMLLLTVLFFGTAVSIHSSGFEKANNKEADSRTFSIYKTNNIDSRNFSFSAESTLGDFEGSTDDVTGAIIFENFEDLTGATFNFWIPLDSLSTGMGMRDDIMKGDCLETDKYPFAEMNGSVIRVLEETNDYVRLSAIGDLLVHGKINPIFFYVTLKKESGKVIMESNFSINMSDFGIERPSLLFVTVEDKLDFEINLTLVGENGGFAVND